MSDLTMSSSGLPFKLEGLISIDANLKEVSKTFPDDFKCYPGYPPNFPGQNIVDEQALITLIPEITVGFHLDLTVFGSGGEISESVTLKGRGWERQFKIRCSQGKVLPEGTVNEDSIRQNYP